VEGSDDEPLEAQLRELERQRAARELTDIGYKLRRNELIVRAERESAKAVAAPAASMSSPVPSLWQVAPVAVLRATQGLVVFQGLLVVITAAVGIHFGLIIGNVQTTISGRGPEPNLTDAAAVLAVAAVLLVIAGLVLKRRASEARWWIAAWELATLVITLLFLVGGRYLGGVTILALAAGGTAILDVWVVIAIESLILVGLVLHLRAPRVSTE
jgi:hypothetical protein